jgi:hypothetical protein
MKLGRFLGLWIGSALMLGWLYWSDPDQGMSTGMMLTGLGTGLLAVAAAHFALKAIFSYREADRRTLFEEARKGNVAAGLALVAQAIILVGLLLVFAPRAHSQDLPPNAITYLPMLKAEQMRGWPDHPAPSILAGQVEQETCISLKHSRCWSPQARLKTEREEGAGFGQLTRAWSAGGGLRFDTVDAVRAIDPGLAALSWANIYQRPDLQLRALVAMNHDCHLRIGRLVEDTDNKFCFCLAAYNGGYGCMQAERRACHLAGNCDPDQWFGHVERHCLKSKTKWKGYGASACDINREYVPNVFIIRREKYKSYFGEM